VALCVQPTNTRMGMTRDVNLVSVSRAFNATTGTGRSTVWITLSEGDKSLNSGSNWRTLGRGTHMLQEICYSYGERRRLPA
jgi:hypothetical protein